MIHQGADMLSVSQGFVVPELPLDDITVLTQLARDARGDVLRMTTLAGSGHPGGSLSSMDIYMMLFLGANVDPKCPRLPGRDRIIVSHGHTSAGLYAALGRTGFILPEDATTSFRQFGSVFEGHPSTSIPGVEWASGNLGQGLSVGCGMALAARYTGHSYRVYVVLGDGEQQKGQLSEAQRWASHHKLGNLTAIIDCNGLQAMGSTKYVMQQDLAAEYSAHGWQVLSVDGHDFSELYSALHESAQSETPSVILARTIMSKGVHFMEDRFEYHGQVLSKASCSRALECLGLNQQVEAASESSGRSDFSSYNTDYPETRVNPGSQRLYRTGDKVACRDAFGNALADIVQANLQFGPPIVAIDCDLNASVKTDILASAAPDRLIQCGIQEHHAASMAGGLSVSGVIPFFADFGVFAIGETYNQQRMNDINHTSVKLVCTHCGLDVGEDGKTHQCVDYIGLFASMFGWKLIIPADANHTDHIVRYMATTPGNIALATGRSKVPVIEDIDGSPVFGEDYSFEYGRADWIRSGGDGVIVTYGTLTAKAIRAVDELDRLGMRIGVLHVSCPLDLDNESIIKAARTGLLMVYEDHQIRTGLGSIVGTFLMKKGIQCKFDHLAINRYGGSGSPEALYKDQGLDTESLVSRITLLLENKLAHR